MNNVIEIQPLSQKKRNSIFILALLVFLGVLPFLYMYATGYRFNFSEPTKPVSTGGIYIAVEEEGANIYIDDTYMGDLRTFRNAFYAQGLDAGTHRIFVQKDGYHTWVKELPVTRHLVTEAEAFNFPLVPHVRVIAPTMTQSGVMVVPAIPVQATSSNALMATSTKKSKLFMKNPEYTELVKLFATTSTSTQSVGRAQQIKDFILGENSTSTETGRNVVATTTKQHNGVMLFEKADGVFARWTGTFDNMPYYYCAPDFERYSTTSPATTTITNNDPVLFVKKDSNEEKNSVATNTLVMHPVQTLTEEDACDPTIQIGANHRSIRTFDFFPGDNNLVVVLLDDGVYVTEIDDRGWQNMQPLFMGNNLSVSVTNGVIYVYDGTLIYQILFDNSAQ